MSLINEYSLQGFRFISTICLSISPQTLVFLISVTIPQATEPLAAQPVRGGGEGGVPPVLTLGGGGTPVFRYPHLRRGNLNLGLEYSLPPPGSGVPPPRTGVPPPHRTGMPLKAVRLYRGRYASCRHARGLSCLCSYSASNFSENDRNKK